MNNIEEQLSALMDGEESDINLVLKNIQDDKVRTRWQRYHLIRDVMRNQVSQVSKVDTHDISLNIQQAIQNEPTVIAPAEYKSKKLGQKTFFKQLGSMAIAATVTAVAILVVQQKPEINNNQSTEIATKPMQAKSIQTASTRNIELNKAVAAKLNSYLVNHNEYAVSSGMQGALPYSRVVNFNPTVKIVRSINAK
ncbi:Sigma factor RpoE negative regulatory protein RseA [hydrothermal vent metagenome]|uniref:Sigma factor RpoE negative regulatory protein RseA n=1 Tax=hydrothermal vent metagenome TaxID=652676 RepID=A0A3B0ZWC0_9ZZZZ